MRARAAHAISDPAMEASILEGVQKCFARYGPEKTGMRDVAEAAGLSRATLYRYFRDRDELVGAYVDWAGDQFIELARAQIDRLATLEAQVAELAVFARAPQRALGLNVAKVAVQDIALLLTVHSEASLQKAIDFLVPYVRAAKQRREVRQNVDATEAAEWLAQIILTAVDMASVTFDADRPDELRQFVSRYVVRGLAGSSSAAPRRPSARTLP